MEARSTGVGDAKMAPPTAHDSRAGDAVQASADLKDRVLAWARGAQLWWTASEAAKAIGAEENVVRSALEELEAEGFVYRAVALADTWRITADGMERLEKAPR